jgi:3-hydroxyacyl-CoA dehydrogenase/enoyl-CoA hydratase/3-hydroxybutyryl-CoA epimerase
MENFKIEVDGDGIALVTFDVPGRSMNTLSGKVIAEIGEVVERIRTDAAIKGAVIASGKASGFCAGADLGELGGSAGAGGEDTRSEQEKLRASFDGAFALNKAFRALETCGKPVATALEGLALGGGLEFALATHYRVAANNPKLQLGLPEAKVGLLPGAGGTQRLPRLVGAMKAAPYLLEGKSMSAQEALGLGVVGAVVEPGQTVAAAREWVKTGDPVAPWDKKDFRLPGGGPYSPTGGQVFIMGNAMLRKQTFGNFPAQLNILKCLYEGLQVPIDAALRIETRYFLKTMSSPQARSMIRTLFMSMQELGKGASRPAGYAPYDIKKVAVLGAGMMGAGIAYVQAQAGIETVLIDVTDEAAQKGKGYAQTLVEKAVKRGKLTAEKGEALLALIHPTSDYSQVKGSDLVVEAVFESRELKATVTKLAEAELAAAAVFGSNTSTLPNTGLAEASARPANFIGRSSWARKPRKRPWPSRSTTS